MGCRRGIRTPPLLLCLSSIVAGSHAFVFSSSTISRQLGLEKQQHQKHRQLPQCQGRCASSRSSRSSSSSGSSGSYGPAKVRDHRRRPRSGKLEASATFPRGRREETPFFLHAVSSPALGEQGVGGVGVSCDGREGSKKVDGGGRRRRPSIGGVVRRMWSRVVSFLTIMTTWVLFRFLLKGLNKVECRNRERLLDAVFERGDQGLLTVSNHMCVYDDPGLWSALVPFWRTGQKKMRWAMCTDDIYNSSPLLTSILDAGKTLPIKRSKGMEQPLFKAFFQKLEDGDWGHIFAEGGIRQPWRFSRGEPILGEFKAGIGRLLLRSKDPPMVLPMYHIGMHQIAPEAPVQWRGRGKLCGMLPNVGRHVRVYVGEPIDVSPIISKCRERVGDVGDLPWTERSSKEEVECHKEIAAYVREHVLKLEAVARREYYGNNPDTCPYSTAE